SGEEGKWGHDIAVSNRHGYLRLATQQLKCAAPIVSRAQRGTSCTAYRELLLYLEGDLAGSSYVGGSDSPGPILRRLECLGATVRGLPVVAITIVTGESDDGDGVLVGSIEYKRRTVEHHRRHRLV